MNARTLQHSGQTVLLIDDTPDGPAALAHALAQRGIAVLAARDGAEALRRARIAPPDLVLLDAASTANGGMETCRRLTREAALRDIPVILVSADAGDKARGFAAGAADVVPRPLHAGEALARIGTHLELRLLRQRLARQNAALQKENALRRQIETQLQRAYESLEQRVALRTEELARLNASLAAEIEERARAEASLRQSEARMNRLFESSLIGIFFWNGEPRIIDANDAFLRLVGYTRQDLLDNKLRWQTLSPPEYAEQTAQAAAQMRAVGTFTPFEKEYVRKDGRRVPVLVSGAVFDLEKKEGASFVLDLTEHKRAEERIRHMANHDALTGLPNRTLLQDRLQQALAHAHRSGSQVAVLFIDLDHFKHINDSLGHQIGDTLLRTVAQRLAACVREDDSVARLGGDEFVLVLQLDKGGTDAAEVARKALDALDQPFHCNSHELHVSGSIGISLYPQDGGDVETLMRTADTAMYYAKEKGRRNYQFFTQALNKAAQRRHAMASALRQALARNELALHYQPQVDLERGTILSAEALLRWRRGEAAVACADFIALAEETGLILPIGEWVLRQACRQLRQWHELGFADLVVAVNLSPRQFFQPNFCNAVRAIVDEEGVPHDRLDLEITESTLMRRTDENVTTLKKLSDMGIKLSIDDFGTGYSSLAYLQRFPVDALKIDQSFVRGIGQNPNDTALVSAIISMAHSLRLNVLAEGVETVEQAGFLRTHGCLSAQGYYFGKAVPADAFTDLLRQQRQRTASA